LASFYVILPWDLKFWARIDFLFALIFVLNVFLKFKMAETFFGCFGSSAVITGLSLGSPIAFLNKQWVCMGTKRKPFLFF